MNIGMISEYFPKSENLEARGGVEARVFNIAKNLSKKNNITIISSRELGTEGKSNIFDIEVLRVGKERPYSQTGSPLSRSLFIKEAIDIGRKRDFDIISGESFLSYPAAWKIGEQLDIPKAMTYHDVWIGKWINNIGIIGAFGEALERYTLSKKWDLIIANSNYTKNNLLNAGVKTDNIVTIYNGVDLKVFDTIAGNRDENPTVCTISRLVKYKRIIDLLNAFKQLNENYPDTRLKIIGSGPEDNHLKKVTSSLNLSKKIDFLGFVKNHADVIKVLKSAHVFAFPSIVEGFGMVLIEAMAAGNPYVASNIPPIREITNEGLGGFLYNPMDVNSLAFYMEKLLFDSSIRAQKIADIPQLIKKFDWSLLANDVETTYRQIIENYR